MQEINVALLKSVTKLATLFISIIFIHLIHSTTAAAKECDFEIYGRQGCYSQANFVCDLETNLCKCLPETPILIDGRICVQKVKVNGVCKYSEQCDNANGFYCTYSDYKLVNNSESSNSPLHRQTNARCRFYKIKHNKHNSSSKYSSSHLSSSSSSSQQHQQHEKSRSSPGMSNFQACVLAFLAACLFLLIILLLLIKSHYQEIREFRPPFQQAEERLSVHSEIDVPPTYEVAIRMKS